jgi:hypothetical protein
VAMMTMMGMGPMTMIRVIMILPMARCNDHEFKNSCLASSIPS